MSGKIHKSLAAGRWKELSLSNPYRILSDTGDSDLEFKDKIEATGGFKSAEDLILQ